jgi:hypothetical protein
VTLLPDFDERVGTGHASMQIQEIVVFLRDIQFDSPAFSADCTMNMAGGTCRLRPRMGFLWTTGRSAR